MKYEWRKQDKDLYLPKKTPVILDVPRMKYLVLSGNGNPNSEGFKESVQSLYALSYGIKMTLKKAPVENYTDYTVFPLEAFWSLDETGIKLQQQGSNIINLKDHFVYTVMIRQPEFVTNQYFEMMKETVLKKKQIERIHDVEYKEVEEGLSCQMMHIGSYDSEPASFQRMEEYCKELGYERISKDHKEIYLSDPNKVEESKLKTTLRFQVIKKV